MTDSVIDGGTAALFVELSMVSFEFFSAARAALCCVSTVELANGLLLSFDGHRTKFFHLERRSSATVSRDLSEVPLFQKLDEDVDCCPGEFAVGDDLLCAAAFLNCVYELTRTPSTLVLTPLEAVADVIPTTATDAAFCRGEGNGRLDAPNRLSKVCASDVLGFESKIDSCEADCFNRVVISA